MKIKKYAKLLLLIPLVFLLTGCTKQLSKVGKQTEEQKKEQTKQEKEQNLSLPKIFSLGKAYQCTYKTNQGQVTTWVKNKKVRAEGIVFGEGAEGSGAMINDGQWMYFWNEKNKQGMKYQLSVMEDVQKEEVETEEAGEFKDPQQWAENVQEKYDVDCKPAAISEGKFSPPENVEFKDLTEMYQKAKEIQESMPSQEEMMEKQGTSEETQKKVDELKDMVKDLNK